MNVLPPGGGRGGYSPFHCAPSPSPAVRVTVRGGVVNDVSEVQLTFDPGSVAETSYTLDVASARRLAYDLREAADVAERHRRAGWPASAGGLETAR